SYSNETPFKVYERLKKLNINTMRLHAQPWRRIWYDLADQMGIMIIHESAVWCFGNQYRVGDPAFWNNFREHLKGQIILHRNHPSIVIWSIENELLLTGGIRNKDTEYNLAKLVDFVKGIDPTRPVMFEGDFDPMGKADIINLHYPHEYPWHDDYPNTAYWLTSETKLDGYPWSLWYWDRKKPLHIGEFLWLPFYSFDILSGLVGEKGYIDPYQYFYIVKAQAWRYQIEAYRVLGVSGFCPWNIFEDNSRDKVLGRTVGELFKPTRFFVLNYTRYFYDNRDVFLKIAVVNDYYENANLTLRLEGYLYGKSVFNSSIDVSLNAFSRNIIEVKVVIPKVDSHKLYYVKVELLRKGVSLHEETLKFHIFSSYIKAGINAKIGVLSEDEDLQHILDSLGLNYITFNEKVPNNVNVVIIGSNKLSDLSPEIIDNIFNYAQSGGKIIVLEQSKMPANSLGVKITNHSSTIAFITYTHHPIFEGLDDNFFKFWAEDHYVSYHDITVPVMGPHIPLIQSGVGLKYTQLMETRYGKGVIIFSQLPIVSKFWKEPRARKILIRLINYTLGLKIDYMKAGVLINSIDLYNSLMFIGADVENTTLDYIYRYDILFIEGKDLCETDIDMLRNFVEKGGTLYIYSIDQEDLETLKDLIQQELVITQVYPPVYFLNHTLVDPIGNEVLYWPTGERLYRHGPYIPDPVITSKSLMIKPEVISQVSIPLENFKVYGSNELIRIRSDRISMYTNGAVYTEIEVNETNNYAIIISAIGTPYEGEYPIVKVCIDGKSCSNIVVNNEWRNYTISFYLTKGNHNLSISFINDAWSPGGEDRNLFISQVWLAKVREKDEDALTRPCILYTINIGSGKVIIDQVPWLKVIKGDIRRNINRAIRYISRLLTALGVKLSLIENYIILGRDLKVNAQLYSIGNELILYTNGYAEATVTIQNDGEYMIGVVAKGTEARGEHPLIKLYVDDENIGQINILNNTYMLYSIQTWMNRGEHRIRIEFVNDYYDPPEDRNLYILALIIM
ncbi:MAG: hypothetical protein DRP08_04485, partial [Candidatus Aenigmatarchaeota archaeon]